MNWQAHAMVWNVAVLLALGLMVKLYKEMLMHRNRYVCPYCRSVGIAQNEMGYCRACGARWRLR